MQGGNPIDGMAAGASEIGHPHIAAPALINQRHPGHAVVISRVRIPDAIKQTSVDLKNDFQVAGEKRAKQLDGPRLQSFRQ